MMGMRTGNMFSQHHHTMKNHNIEVPLSIMSIFSFEVFVSINMLCPLKHSHHSMKNKLKKLYPRLKQNNKIIK